ncbi:MAG: hypothetical protein JSW51_08780 [Gemmatimonadota bacterium]|nr:MAG: hypothetical protein JSW51_08780 [Gemmatimonadota bacterium]
MLVGAYDPTAWAGLVLSDRPGRGFGFEFAVERDGERAEGYDLLHVVHEVGPCAPDASYARVSFDTYLPFGKGHDTPTIAKSGRVAGLTLEWSRNGQDSVVGRLAVSFDGVVELRGYFPWDWSGAWKRDRPADQADSESGVHLTATTTDGESILHLALHRDGDQVERDAIETRVDSDGNAVVVFPVTTGDQIYFTASLRSSCTARAIGDESIVHRLCQAELDYEQKRVKVLGHWDELASSITNSLHWMQSIKPESGRRYIPAGRRWIFPKANGGRDHWTTFCWDSFFNALELNIESSELARETLLAVLETQYENGNIPNWRGRFAGTPDRSQPPVGSFVVLKHYLRTGDISLLEEAFPHLDRWSAWWREPKGNALRRDGNHNGLFEWGCDIELLGESPASWENEATHHQMAAWESGQDDLPNWDEADWIDDAETLDLDCVDLNALMALDYECLARIADSIGLTEQASDYSARYREISVKVNELLWNDDIGMYVDRRWDGSLSPRLAASNFYPLVAGIPSSDRAERMLETLLDESKFWGLYVLPSASRDDPLYEQQQYWRGTIWPPPNYLVYQGLRRYGLDEIAGELAARSVDLFLKSWRDYQLCRENYDSRTGEGGGHAYQSWGPLFAVMGIEEFIDVTPWDGLRIGTLAPPPDSTLKNISLCNHIWSVSLSAEGLRITVDGEAMLQTQGVVVLRHVELQEESLAANTLALEPVTLAVTRKNGTSKEITVPPGEHEVTISR